MEKPNMRTFNNSSIYTIVFCVAAFMLYAVVEKSGTIEDTFSEDIFQNSSETIELIAAPKPILENGNARLDICGTDDRVSETDPAVGRIRYGSDGVCTAFIISNGLLVTAGHCIDNILFDGGESIVEFNVKDSESNGDLVDSDPEDRYVINETAIQSSDWINENGIIGGGIAPDWGVFRVKDNDLTGLQPIIAQNTYYEIEIPATSLPSTTLRVTGYGVDSGVDNQTLQTHAITDNYSPSTVITYSIDTQASNSGSPIINVNTGKAIGVHTDGDGCQNGGNTFRNTNFRNAANPSSTIVTELDQRRESGSQLSGSTVGEWNGSSFTSHTISGTLPAINSNFGDIEVFRGSQSVVASPNEKYNRWTVNSSQDQVDVRNHREFLMFTDALLTSQFKSTHNATINNYYPEFPSLTPSSDKILFKDPWLIDYADPDYGNNTRNRGYFAPFKEVNSGSSNNIGISTSYKGVFINQDPFFDDNVPNYTIKAPESINFGGALGTRGVSLIEWESSDAILERDGLEEQEETAVVFTSANAEVTAHLKISQASNDASAYANNSQRKVVRTSDGWLHMVYESMGRVWLEHSDDDGATWTLADNGNPLDAGAGKNPSIDWLYSGSTFGNYVVVVYQQKNGSYYNIIGKIFKRGSSGYHYHTAFNLGTVGSTESYSVDANPNISWGGNLNNTGAGDFTLTVEKKSGTAGIYYLYGELSANGNIMSSSLPTHLSGTNANSTNTSVHINKMYNNLDAFHIVYQQGSGSIKYKFIECYPSGSTWYCSNTYTANLSSSTGQQNYKPSMVQMPGGGLKVSWIRALYGQSSPYWMNTVYWSSSSPSQYTIRGYFVRSVSLNVSNNNSKYLYAWSEQVNTYYANKLSNGSSTTNLSTSGEEVQLSNGTGSGANMLVSSFDRTSTPYAFKNTGNVGGQLKSRSPAPINYGRGVALHKDDLRFNYTMKSLSVDNKNIKFVEIPQDKPDSAKSKGQWGVKYLKLKKLNKYILSEPFDIDNQTGISFSEEAGFIDREQAVTELGRKGYIRYKVELVDERTNEVIRLLNEAEYSAAHLPQDTLRRYIGNTGETTKSTARVKITISSNMDDLQGVLLSEYGTTDKEMLSKMAAQTLELTPAEEVTNYALGQNYPNPFNPTTQISYQLPEHSQVQLEVFDLLGRKVATLVNERQTTGRYNVTFDASHLASGVYLYRLTAGEFTESKKLFLIK